MSYQKFACATNFFNAKVRPYYSEPHRAYHTPVHIHDMLSMAYQLLPISFLSAEQLIAIMFHDAIYIPGCDDNEALSARIMRTVFKQQEHNLPVAYEFTDLNTVEQIILDTKSHKQSIEESAVVLDLDMAILGSTTDEYDEYRNDIFYEFSLFQGPLFIDGRKEFLRSILGSQIFHTDIFRMRFEEAAQANVERELKSLGG